MVNKNNFTPVILRYKSRGCCVSHLSFVFAFQLFQDLLQKDNDILQKLTHLTILLFLRKRKQQKRFIKPVIE